MNIDATSNVTYRFGIYGDVSGQPGSRIAETPLSSLHDGTNEVPVTVPELVGCADGNVPQQYWLLGLWRSDVAIDFVAETTPSTPAVYSSLIPSIDDALKNGLPKTFPGPSTQLAPEFKQPHIYAIVAKIN